MLKPCYWYLEYQEDSGHFYKGGRKQEESYGYRYVGKIASLESHVFLEYWMEKYKDRIKDNDILSIPNPPTFKEVQQDYQDFMSSLLCVELDPVNIEFYLGVNSLYNLEESIRQTLPGMYYDGPAYVSTMILQNVQTRFNVTNLFVVYRVEAKEHSIARCSLMDAVIYQDPMPYFMVDYIMELHIGLMNNNSNA